MKDEERAWELAGKLFDSAHLSTRQIFSDKILDLLLDIRSDERQQCSGPAGVKYNPVDMFL